MRYNIVLLVGMLLREEKERKIVIMTKKREVRKIVIERETMIETETEIEIILEIETGTEIEIDIETEIETEIGAEKGKGIEKGVEAETRIVVNEGEVEAGWCL